MAQSEEVAGVGCERSVVCVFTPSSPRIHLPSERKNDCHRWADRQTDRLKPHRDVGRSDRLAGQTNLNLDSTYTPAANTTKPGPRTLLRRTNRSWTHPILRIKHTSQPPPVQASTADHGPIPDAALSKIMTRCLTLSPAEGQGLSPSHAPTRSVRRHPNTMEGCAAGCARFLKTDVSC